MKKTVHLREDKGHHSSPCLHWSWLKSDRWKLFEKMKKQCDRRGRRKESENLFQVKIQEKLLKEEGEAEFQHRRKA